MVPLLLTIFDGGKRRLNFPGEFTCRRGRRRDSLAFLSWGGLAEGDAQVVTAATARGLPSAPAPELLGPLPCTCTPEAGHQAWQEAFPMCRVERQGSSYLPIPLAHQQRTFTEPERSCQVQAITIPADHPEAGLLNIVIQWL